MPLNNLSKPASKTKNKKDFAKNKNINSAHKKDEIPFSLPLFSSFIVIKGSALNKERLFCALTSSAISVYKPTVVGRFLYFAVNYKDKAKTFAICDKLCYNISIYWKIGLKSLLKSMLFRLGIPIGAIICAVICAGFGKLIWKIEITGTQNIDNVVILNSLKENNVFVGAKKDIDLRNVTTMLNSIDGVEDCVVEMVGTTLKIYVYESVEFIPPVIPAQSSVVSNFDGVVTNIVVRSGTALVAVGDVVRCGDVIIKGEIVNQAGEVIQVVADGEAYGEVAYREHEIVSTATAKRIVSHKIRHTALSFFGINIGAKLPEGYEIVKSTKKLWLIPIKVTTYLCKKIEYVQSDVTLEELKENFLQQMMLKYAIVSDKIEINSQKLADNIYRLNVYIRATVCLTK